jgi:hypothetical protein
MTTQIKVSVNGNYKIPVKQGETVTWVSGRGYAGPNEITFNPYSHGDGSVFVIGPEEPDPEPELAPKPLTEQRFN